MINKEKIFAMIFGLVAILLGVLCVISFIHVINYSNAINNCEMNIIFDGIHGNIKQLYLLEHKSINHFVVTGIGTFITTVVCWTMWKI